MKISSPNYLGKNCTYQNLDYTDEKFGNTEVKASCNEVIFKMRWSRFESGLQFETHNVKNIMKRGTKCIVPEWG